MLRMIHHGQLQQTTLSLCNLRHYIFGYRSLIGPMPPTKNNKIYDNEKDFFYNVCCIGVAWL